MSHDAIEGKASAELVQRILVGDHNAEQEMVKRYQNNLLAMLRVRSRDSGLANDIVNETWSLVLVKIRDKQLKDEKKLAPFIMQVGRNLLLMHYRKNKKNEHDGEDSYANVPSSSLSPEQELENQQLGIKIWQVLKSLKKPRDQLIIKRYLIDEATKHKVCSELNVTSVYFDKVLFRARQRFKESWDKKG